MKSKFESVNVQEQKQNEDKLECVLRSLHRRGNNGDYTEDCPICNRTNQLIVVINQKLGIANCSRCKIGVKVRFGEG